MEQPQNQNQRHIVRSLFLLTALIFIGFCGWALYDGSIISIKYMGKGRTATIYRELEWEVNRGTRFAIHSGLNVESPGCAISYEDFEVEEVSLVFANSKDVIGLLFTFGQDPRPRLLVMYEFSSGRIWPCGGDLQDKNYLRQELESENPILNQDN